MANFYQSNKVTGIDVPPNPSFAGEVVRQRGSITLPAGITINDRLELCVLPANCTLFDAILDSDDLDSATTITLDGGLMSGEVGAVDIARTVGTELFSASTVAQAGGVVRPTLSTAFRIAPVPYDRSIGLLVKAAPTGQAGSVHLIIFYGNP